MSHAAQVPEDVSHNLHVGSPCPEAGIEQYMTPSSSPHQDAASLTWLASTQPR
jgi:hypothetical protein